MGLMKETREYLWKATAFDPVDGRGAPEILLEKKG
jgi:hypothetical protein